MVDLTQLQTPPATQAPFPAVQLANTFVERFGQVGQLDHLKLQKLAYFTYGWWLALARNQAPISASKPQVWKFGPVFQPIYSSFAMFRDGNITQPQPIGPFSGTYSIDNNSSFPSQFVDWIWQRYGYYSGKQLSDMTHEVGTPWYETAKKHNFVVPRFCEMDDDEVRTFFSQLAVKEGLVPAVAAG